MHGKMPTWEMKRADSPRGCRVIFSMLPWLWLMAPVVTVRCRIIACGSVEATQAVALCPSAQADVA